MNVLNLKFVRNSEMQMLFNKTSLNKMEGTLGLTVLTRSRVH